MAQLNDSGSQTLVRYRGEEVWIGDEHIANLRLDSDSDTPVVVQCLDGTVRFRAHDRRTAEVWARLHAAELRRPRRPS
ncbi:hypothetical protein C5B96_13125 [Subtercola sp. Z020]|uniref:hypothetical protein n=1 Tax=Subtercola sp. Z020 TaxID=2080582 RepID=UPI000CE803E9|nr:hypothetical protein [Subtercola sp. Z020]PPF79332.1 hypothetical protein C5B96_13125 [Subtercola sp. Z020]